MAPTVDRTEFWTFSTGTVFQAVDTAESLTPVSGLALCIVSTTWNTTALRSPMISEGVSSASSWPRRFSRKTGSVTARASAEEPMFSTPVLVTKTPYSAESKREPKTFTVRPVSA